MTEYTASSQAVREFMSSRERTAYWVQVHSPSETDFYSPSIPPSELDAPIPSSPPSEADSSHSIPPKMVLHYRDGRPDIPIPHPEQYGLTHSGSTRRREGPLSRHNSQPYGHESRSRAMSHGAYSPQSPKASSRRYERERSPPRAPEEIRILPSLSGGVPTSSSTSRTRSKSLSKPFDSPSSQSDTPIMNAQPSFAPSKQMYPSSAHFSQPPSQAHSQAPIFNQTPPTWHSYSGRAPHGPRNPSKHAPPAIVYAPSHHSRSHYAPPAMYSHPPQMGPNGMIYSHSAPVPSTHYSNTGSSYAPAGYPAHDLATFHEERRKSASKSRSGRDHSRSRSSASHTRVASPARSTTSFESRQSGSTYYVLPTAGQKAASPEQPMATRHHSGTHKKPFFQRLFSLAERLSSAGSAKGSSVAGGSGRRRRHSTGASRRPRLTELEVDQS